MASLNAAEMDEVTVEFVAQLSERGRGISYSHQTARQAVEDYHDWLVANQVSANNALNAEFRAGADNWEKAELAMKVQKKMFQGET